MTAKTEIMATKLDIDLKNAFMGIAASKHKPASQILRDLIRLYVDNNKNPNEVTLETFKKTDRGEDVHCAKDMADLLKQLDI